MSSVSNLLTRREVVAALDILEGSPWFTERTLRTLSDHGVIRPSARAGDDYADLFSPLDVAELRCLVRVMTHMGRLNRTVMTAWANNRDAVRHALDVRTPGAVYAQRGLVGSVISVPSLVAQVKRQAAAIVVPLVGMWTGLDAAIAQVSAERPERYSRVPLAELRRGREKRKATDE